MTKISTIYNKNGKGYDLYVDLITQTGRDTCIAQLHREIESLEGAE